MNIAVAILGKCDNYPNCRVSKNKYPDSCFDVGVGGRGNAKELFIATEKRLSGSLLRPRQISAKVYPNKDLGLFIIKDGKVGKDWATFYDGNIIRSYCSKKSEGSRGYRIIYRYNISGWWNI